MKIPYVAFAAGVILAASMTADTLVLKNGAKLEGMYLGGDARTVRFVGPDRTPKDYSITSISAIEFSSQPAPAAAAAPAPAAASAPVAAAGPAVTIPAGTVVTVRTIDSIDTDTTAIGERFRCSIDDPVVLSDRVVIPRGADCTMQVMKVEQGGRRRGSDELAIKLYDVTVNGRAYDVAASYAEMKTKGEGKSTAKKTIGGAGLGALIGGLAGGGRGAAIGAAAGAGAGVAVSSIKGPHLVVPSETRLTFELRAPLPLN